MRKNSGMWKTISRKEKLRRVLLIIFGAGVIALAGVSYQYVKNAVPDRINVVVDRQEQVRFGLPFRAWIYNPPKAQPVPTQTGAAHLLPSKGPQPGHLIQEGLRAYLPIGSTSQMQ